MKVYNQSDHNLAHFKSPRQANLYLLKYDLNVMVVKQDFFLIGLNLLWRISVY